MDIKLQRAQLRHDIRIENASGRSKRRIKKCHRQTSLSVLAISAAASSTSPASLQTIAAAMQLTLLIALIVCLLCQLTAATNENTQGQHFVKHPGGKRMDLNRLRFWRQNQPSKQKKNDENVDYQEYHFMSSLG
uniref:Uncharacterized protein n=1 Tax=Plectus sambesii TaxID=2011161 RepID=A0A914XHW0_9BILA